MNFLPYCIYVNNIFVIHSELIFKHFIKKLFKNKIKYFLEINKNKQK